MFDHVIIIVWLMLLGRKAHARNRKCCHCKTTDRGSIALVRFHDWLITVGIGLLPML